jgi:predicted short-subunit dehydrogenase-like oxidoreductase (DUF2520 family)
MYSLGIIGGGRAAWAFGSAWRRIGWPISGVALRGASDVPRLLDAPQRPISELAADSDLLLIAVSDRAIHEVAASIPETRAVIWHPSGSLTSVRDGFSLHPLRALAPAGEPSDIRDTLLVFEGNHREIAERIASAIGARFAEIAAQDKPRYHAAAVFASNYVAALLDIANELNPVSDARGDLVALAQSALENWGQHEDARRFTGPAARGDRDVIKAHIDLLQTQHPLALIYELLADRILATRK